VRRLINRLVAEIRLVLIELQRPNDLPSDRTRWLLSLIQSLRLVQPLTATKTLASQAASSFYDCSSSPIAALTPRQPYQPASF